MHNVEHFPLCKTLTEILKKKFHKAFKKTGQDRFSDINLCFFDSNFGSFSQKNDDLNKTNIIFWISIKKWVRWCVFQTSFETFFIHRKNHLYSPPPGLFITKCTCTPPMVGSKNNFLQKFIWTLANES